MKLAQGQKASITSDAIGSDQVFSGTVDKVVNFASKNAGSDGSSSSSGGYSATITLEPGTPLLLGMSVNVEIMLNEEGEQLAVPYDSIATDDDGNSYVFVGKEGKYCPSVGRSKSPIMFIRVDLPEPDSPTIDTNSP